MDLLLFLVFDLLLELRAILTFGEVEQRPQLLSQEGVDVGFGLLHLFLKLLLLLHQVGLLATKHITSH